MSRAAVLALAACSAPAAPHVAVVAPTAGPVVTAPVVHRDPGDGGIEAPPAGAIQLVAVTPDGGAALTADQLHEARLWPALDGSQEPRIVRLPEAHALALGRRGDGFTAAVLDAAGGLYIATLDAQGRIHSHVSLPVDPAWTGIAMAASGLVAWRADQSLVVLDGDGATVARLGTDPGERIVSVAVAGDRAAVLLDGGGKRGVRMVALDAPAWGAWRDLGTDTADLVALAASGQFAVRDSNTATVYDATGTLVRTLHGAGAGSLAFVDDTHLAMSANGTLQWLAIGKQPAMASGIVNATVVAAGGRAIAGASGDLVLATPAETRYLGYDVPVPSVARAAGGGQLVVASMAKLYTVDDHLRVVAAPNLPVREHALELQWLGDDAWAAETALIGDETGDFRLIDHGTAHVLRKQLDVTYVLGYEPTTHLLTLSLGASSAVYRYDPVKHELALVAVEPASNMYMEVELIPLDPARAGAQLLQVTSHGATRLDWLPDATKLEEPGASVRVSGSLAAADPAGNAYVWVSTAQGMELDVYRDGKRVGTLPTDGPVSVWPDPAGGRIVEIAPHAVSMVTTAGQRAWTMQLDRPTSAVWLSDGALAIVTAAGIVRVEPATGNVMATRCGWGFGLSATPHASPPAIEPVCSQLEGAD